MTGRPPHALRWIAPTTTMLAALTLDLLPLTAVPGPAPSFTLCLVYAWTLRAAELLPAAAVFLAGLVLDGVAGMPLGFSSLTLLLVHAGVLAGRRILLGAPFAAAWAAFALAALAGGGVRWLLAALWWGQLFPPRPVLAEAALTFVAYPLAGWPVTRLQPPSRLGARAPGG